MRAVAVSFVGAIVAVGCIVDDSAKQPPRYVYRSDAEAAALRAREAEKAKRQEAERQRELERTRQALEVQARRAREESLQAQAKEHARLEAEAAANAAAELKNAKDWQHLEERIRSPAPSVRPPRAKLAGKLAGLAPFEGKRIRVDGKYGRQGEESVSLHRRGKVRSVNGRFGGYVTISKTRAAFCWWEGLTAWPAVNAAEDNDTVALVGTLKGAIPAKDKQPEFLVLTDCDVPRVIRKAPLPRITAAGLTAAYARNQVSAVDNWENVKVEITGVVHAVTPGSDGTVVHLRGHNARHRVYCQMAADASVDSLGRGRVARLRGVVAAYHQGTWRDWWQNGVVLERCEVSGR